MYKLLTNFEVKKRGLRVALFFTIVSLICFFDREYDPTIYFSRARIRFFCVHFGSTGGFLYVHEPCFRIRFDFSKWNRKNRRITFLSNRT